MANRVLIGNRGGQYGLFVSKAGTNVANTSLAEDNIIFSTSSSSIDEFLQFPAVGNTATSTSTTTATISNVGATGTATYLAADLDYSKITYIGISEAYIPEGSLTGGSTSTTVTKPSTFENSGITNNNIADDIQYFALTDIF